MSESSKAKAAGVSASSFLNLIGEVAKTTEEMKKAKAAGQKLPPSKPAKKPTVWARKNRGVEKRQQKDIELEIKSHKTYNSAIGTLGRKVEIYNKLSKGQSAGLTEEQFKNLNVDFDLKAYESDDEVDESLTVPTAPMEDDPDTDYVDEYGRTRTAPRSQVPRQHLLKPGENIDADDDVVLYNPTRRVTYRAADHEEKKAQFLKAQLEQDKPPEDVHFDPTKHNREYGAGHIRFAQDNATRNKEMEELKKVHLDTKQARDASGAIDASVEGMSAPDTMPSQTSALKKRKLDMEARKQELKRRKGGGSTAPAASTTMSQVFTASTSADPFASLERQATDVVDSFLSSVEEELRNKGQ